MTAKKRTTKRKKGVDPRSLAGVCDELRTAPKGAGRSATEEAVGQEVLVPFIGGPCDGRQARTRLGPNAVVRGVSVDGKWYEHKYHLESLNTVLGSYYFFLHSELSVDAGLRALLANYRPPPIVLIREGK